MPIEVRGRDVDLGDKHGGNHTAGRRGREVLGLAAAAALLSDYSCGGGSRKCSWKSRLQHSSATFKASINQLISHNKSYLSQQWWDVSSAPESPGRHRTLEKKAAKDPDQ